uniref:Uncharacterized protein n=1 Tax=Globodera rostochiensis TaxID=31243 RepID=A0A914HG72_GLORO
MKEFEFTKSELMLRQTLVFGFQHELVIRCFQCFPKTFVGCAWITFGSGIKKSNEKSVIIPIYEIELMSGCYGTTIMLMLTNEQTTPAPFLTKIIEMPLNAVIWPITRPPRQVAFTTLVAAI